VIDLSAVISGPFGTSILADQGADVIMVEQAHAPELIRNAGPLAKDSEASALFVAQNRNKRSIGLNLKCEAGKQLLKDMVKRADVLVQNFRPGAMDRLALGWDVLSAINDQLIMCSVSGFGASGQYSHRPAFDPIVQSVGSYPTVQADAAGVPKLVATAVCDKLTSLYVAQSISAALVARANGAGGQHIELAMLDAGIHFLWPDGMQSCALVNSDGAASHETPGSAPFELYQTQDGWLMVFDVATDAHWQQLCRALGREALASDPRFSTVDARAAHRSEVTEQLREDAASYTTAKLLGLLDEIGIPAAPVNSRQSMIDDPHVNHRGIVVQTVHPSAGRIRQVRPPVIFSKTPSGLRRHAPLFGEHTDEVLAEVLEKSVEDIAALRADAVVK
jgi:CoA:oxalate CoA-transferase